MWVVCFIAIRGYGVEVYCRLPVWNFYNSQWSFDITTQWSVWRYTVRKSPPWNDKPRKFGSSTLTKPEWISCPGRMLQGFGEVRKTRGMSWVVPPRSLPYVWPLRQCGNITKCPGRIIQTITRENPREVGQENSSEHGIILGIQGQSPTP